LFLTTSFWNLTFTLKNMTDRQLHLDTQAIHAGHIPDAATGARASLIDPASAVVGGTEAFRPWAQSMNMAA
jgi:hypothetical protein